MMPDEPDDQNENGGPSHDLTHNFVVDESDPMDHEKTQLQRDDEYHTMSMSASQNMLATEWEDRPAIDASRHAGVFASHSVTGGGAKVQASSDFESEIRAREEKERKEKEWLEQKKREEE